MTTLDPPWKQKTRPCPFYSQGRCLFSDSCNFLHDVKIKVHSPKVVSTPNVFHSDSPESTYSPSPKSLVSPTHSLNGLSVRSPPRSPRLSSLLMALGDAISPEQDAPELSDSPYSGSSYDDTETVHPRDSFNALKGEEQATYPPAPPADAESPVAPQVEEVLRAEEDSEKAALIKLHQASMLELKERFSLTSRYRSTSPVTSPKGIPAEEVSEHDPHSVGDKDAEEAIYDIPEVPEAITASRPVSQAFSVQAMSDISSLLSPISITLAPPATTRLLQFETCHREDSIDSGYVENETGPTHATPPLTSPRRLSNVSTLSLLSSPFGSTSSRVLSPTFGPSSSAAWPASTLFSAGSDSHHPELSTEENVADPFDDLDSPSDYHLRRRSNGHTEAVSDTELTATVKPPSTPPLPDEGFDEESSSDNGPSNVNISASPTPEPSRPSSRASQGSFLERYYAEQGSPLPSSSPLMKSPTSPRPPVFSKPPRAGPSSLRISVSRSPPRLQAELASETLPLSAVAPSHSAISGQRDSGIVSAPTSAADLQRRESKKVPFGFRHA
ncbi:hypothetical protein K474DRAFT_1691366, partial [Panus rudis PR-1116 ss-1]